jgi:hypothetical protein
MKNKTFRLLGLSTVFATALTIGFSSCKKDKNDNGGASGQFSATIGSNAFRPSQVEADLSQGFFEIAGIQVVSGDSLILDLGFPDTVTVNSKLNFYSSDLSYVTTKSLKFYSSSASSAHGSVTFTTVDKTNKKLAGKFSGVLYGIFGTSDSLVIKDGQFNTAYKAQ